MLHRFIDSEDGNGVNPVLAATTEQELRNISQSQESLTATSSAPTWGYRNPAASTLIRF